MNNYNQIDPYIGYMRGNLFNNLYKPYKNYNFAQISPSNEKEYKMLLLQTYGFGLTDLNLYLDTNPNDNNMIKLYNEYLNNYNQALADYENRYGPLTLNSNSLNTSPWAWLKTKWPWEVESNV